MMDKLEIIQSTLLAGFETLKKYPSKNPAVGLRKS